MNPQTIEEWAEYISELHGEELWSVGVNANSLVFVTELQEEGYEPDQIVDILLMFALQFQRDDQALPTDLEDQYLSYPSLLASAGREP